MADDFSKRNKDAKEFYETQMNIAETIKRQTDNWTNFNEATKEGAKNAKKIKETQAEINRLIAEGSDESKQKAAQLQKELDYLKEYNKELLKTKTLIQAGGKALKKWGTDTLISKSKELFGIYDKIDAAVRSASINMGMSVTRMETARTIAHDTERSMAALGMEAGFAGQMMSSFAEETGRQVMMSQQSLETLTKISKRTGITTQEMASLAGQMEAFGFGAEGSAQTIESIEDMSNKMGVNTQKVIKKVQTNLKLVNKLSFKGGVKGMAQMAAYSEKYKLSMEAVAL
jgi:methyl-accepting chemotaxis protein